MALALIPASVWWEPRPHAFSLLFIMVTVALLARQRFWWLPLVFLVWANCHGGVLLGFVLLGAGLGVQTLLAPRTLPRAVLVFLACMMAATATPLGLSFWFEIPSSLARIRLYPLDEWRRPLLTELPMLPFWIIAAAFCYGLFRRRHRLRQASPGEATLYACALALLPMSRLRRQTRGAVPDDRCPALTTLLPWPRRSDDAARVEHPVLNVTVMTLASLAVVATVTWAYSNQIPKLRWTPVPAGALAALRHCPDNLYNRYDEGGYLIWFAPDRKVFMDGRPGSIPARARARAH